MWFDQPLPFFSRRFFFVLPFLVSPCLALPCLALPCLVLACLGFPCLSLPRLASPCPSLKPEATSLPLAPTAHSTTHSDSAPLKPMPREMPCKQVRSALPLLRPRSRWEPAIGSAGHGGAKPWNHVLSAEHTLGSGSRAWRGWVVLGEFRTSLSHSCSSYTTRRNPLGKTG
jgi:hypothetical protein